MDLREYYKLPEGTAISFKYLPSFFDTVKPFFPCPHNMSYAFVYYKGNTLPKIDTSNVTDMSYMFQQCVKFTSLDLSNWDTSKVTNMENMFYYCSKLTAINGIENWDTSNVTKMNYMFQYCTNLTAINGIENLDTSNVTTIQYMFSGCKNFISFDISNWDTSKVTNMGCMFENCDKLETLSSINCSGITGTDHGGAGLFGYSGLSSLKNFGGWIGLKKSVTNYGINKCPNLTYESCINVLNGLFDFVGNGITPASNEGKLKVHANFLTAVGDEVSIGTSKGWTITA